MWKAVGYIFLGLLSLLLITLVIPVYLQLRFKEELTICIRIWGIPVFRFSSADEKKTESSKRDEPSTGKSVASSLKSDGVNATIQYVKQITSLVVNTARRIFSAITVDKLIIKLTVASADASQTAQNTGRVCAVLYPAVTALQNVVNIRKREVTVIPDFLGEKGKAELELLAHAMPLKMLFAVRQYFAVKSIIKKENREEVEHGK